MPRRLSAAAIRARIRTLEKQAKKLEQGASKGLRAAASLISKYGLSLDDLKRAIGLSKGADVPGTYCWGTYTATLRVYGAGPLLTMRFAGSAGSTVERDPGVRAMPG